MRMSETTLSTVTPPQPVPSRPLGELLPKGGRAVMVAAVAAALVAGDFVRFGATGWAYIGVVLCPVLVLLASIDLQHRLLPNRIVLPAALVVVVVVAATQRGDLVTHLAAGLALGALFFAVGALFPGSLGMGDAKLGLLLGLALGSKTFAAIEFALLAVLIAAVWIIATQGMAARKKAIPFGPFLGLGGILGLFLG
jgi:leader peptidase (prepilin peptidase) / N-methyltransferase